MSKKNKEVIFREFKLNRTGLPPLVGYGTREAYYSTKDTPTVRHGIVSWKEIEVWRQNNNRWSFAYKCGYGFYDDGKPDSEDAYGDIYPFEKAVDMMKELIDGGHLRRVPELNPIFEQLRVVERIGEPYDETLEKQLEEIEDESDQEIDN